MMTQLKIWLSAVLLMISGACAAQKPVQAPTPPGTVSVGPAPTLLPLPYPVARIDQLVTQPLPLQNWGGATGAGKRICFPQYNGICVIRITDRNTLPSHGSLSTSDAGSVQLTTVDSKHIIAHTNGGSVVLGFDPVAETATGKVQLGFNYEVQASEHDPQVLYSLNGTQIQQRNVNATWTGIASHVVVFDFASDGCLGTGFIPRWHGVFSFGGDPPVFGTSFSNDGPQGSGHYSVAWSKAMGCTVWDTVTGTVIAGGKQIGTVNIPDRFKMHAGSLGQNPAYLISVPTVAQPNGTSGCLIAAGCYQRYFWKIGTLEVDRCGPPHNKPPYCDGHPVQTMTAVFSGGNYVEHSWSDPSTPLTSFGKLPPGSGDTHHSSNNGADVNGKPVFIFSQVTPAPTTFLVWGTDEIMALALDGSKRFMRFGQNGNSGKSLGFVCRNAIGVAFQQGNFALFTSDQGGTLGLDGSGKQACDVFAIEAK